MKQALEQRVAELSQEIHALHEERRAIEARNSEIEIRLHQLVGAVFEMQRLIADLDHQPSVQEQVQISEVPRPQD